MVSFARSLDGRSQMSKSSLSRRRLKTTLDARRHAHVVTTRARSIEPLISPPRMPNDFRPKERPMTYGNAVSPRVDAALRIVIDHGVIGTCPHAREGERW